MSLSTGGCAAQEHTRADISMSWSPGRLAAAELLVVRVFCRVLAVAQVYAMSGKFGRRYSRVESAQRIKRDGSSGN